MGGWFSSPEPEPKRDDTEDKARDMFRRGAKWVADTEAMGYKIIAAQLWVDADGYLFIEGRADDTIIRGGENIAPAEIEDVLRRHDSVLDVAVVGVPDDEWGQEIAAVVVLGDGIEATDDMAFELHEFCKQHLRSSKTPRVIEFRPELPHTPTGKLLRREVLADLLG